MTKSCFMSSAGDPFTTLFAHKLFKERWYEEVDTFYVGINNHCGVPQEVLSEIIAKLALDPKTHIIYHPMGVGNGIPITEMTLVSKEDLVMLLEDDGFIFESGIVKECFQQIESGVTDIVGSPRFSCGVEIGEAAQKKYNLDYSGYGDKGPWMWPNFFFCKRADLLKTDLNFASKSFLPGEYSKELDHTFTEINHADTFGWGMIQLRALGLRCAEIPQHKADPYEAQNKEQEQMNWHPTQQPFKWIHGGSLSTGWGGYITGNTPDVSNESAMLEMETRCAFWQICSDAVDGFTEFKVKYQQGIKDLVNRAGLDQGRIDQKILIYKNLLQI